MNRKIKIIVCEGPEGLGEKFFIRKLVINRKIVDYKEYDHMDALLDELYDYYRKVFDDYKVDCRFDEYKIEMNVNVGN